MKTSFTLLLIALSSLLLTQALPRFRSLQQNITVVDNTTVVVAPPNNTNSTSNSTGNSTNNGTNNTVINPYPGYTQVNTSNLTASWYDPSVYGAFYHGVNALVQTIVFQQKAPLAVYNVTSWVWAYYRDTRAGRTYQFSVLLANARGVNIAMNLTVNYNRANNVNSLGGYSFRVNNIPSGSFPANGYKYATPSQVNTSVPLQGALKYGAQWMIQYLVDGGKIPSTDLNYSMTALNLAVYRAQTNATSYRFQTKNVNNAGVNVNTNYTVLYNSSEQTYSIASYSYSAFNYSDADLPNITNNTNNTNSTQNVTVVAGNGTSLNGTDSVTVTDNSTVATGSGNQTVPSNSSSSETNNTITEPQQNVTVDTSAVTAYIATNTTTPLVNYNRPPLPVSDDTDDESDTDVQDMTENGGSDVESDNNTQAVATDATDIDTGSDIGATTGDGQSYIEFATDYEPTVIA